MRKASRRHEIQPWARVVVGRRLRYTGHNSKLAASRAPVWIRRLRKFCCIVPYREAGCHVEKSRRDFAPSLNAE